MAIPDSRDLTVANGGAVPSSTYNAIQDAIVNGSHGVIEERQVPLLFATNADLVDWVHGSSGNVDDNYWEAAGAGTPDMIVRLPLAVGDVLVDVFARVVDNYASGQMGFSVSTQSLVAGAPAAAPAVVDSTTSAGNSLNIQKLALEDLDLAVTADVIVSARVGAIGAAGTAHRLYSISYTVRRPL
jgi:hypothetical protein